MKILDKIIKNLNEKYKVDICDPIQEGKHMRVRKAYYNALIPYFTQSELGRSLNRKHSTVYRYCESHAEDMKTFLYREAYEYSRTRYMELLNETEAMALVDPTAMTNAIIQIRKSLAELENQIILIKNANS